MKKLIKYLLVAALMIWFAFFLANKYGWILWLHQQDYRAEILRTMVATVGNDAKSEVGYAVADHGAAKISDEDLFVQTAQQVMRVNRAKEVQNNPLAGLHKNCPQVKAIGRISELDLTGCKSADGFILTIPVQYRDDEHKYRVEFLDCPAHDCSKVKVGAELGRLAVAPKITAYPSKFSIVRQESDGVYTLRFRAMLKNVAGDMLRITMEDKEDK